MLFRSHGNAPALSPNSPVKPVPKREPQRRPAPRRPEPDTPMKPFERPAEPDERPCPRPAPDTAYPTCSNE